MLDECGYKVTKEELAERHRLYLKFLASQKKKNDEENPSED